MENCSRVCDKFRIGNKVLPVNIRTPDRGGRTGSTPAARLPDRVRGRSSPWSCTVRFIRPALPASGRARCATISRAVPDPPDDGHHGLVQHRINRSRMDPALDPAGKAARGLALVTSAACPAISPRPKPARRVRGSPSLRPSPDVSPWATKLRRTCGQRGDAQPRSTVLIHAGRWGTGRAMAAALRQQVRRPGSQSFHKAPWTTACVFRHRRAAICQFTLCHRQDPSLRGRTPTNSGRVRGT